MKFITNKTGGRLANQLYFVLQAYCKSMEYKENIKYFQMPAIAPIQDLSIYSEKLNIQKYYCNKNCISSSADVQIFEQPINTYYQYIGKDFDEHNLNRFIDETIIKSNYFNNLKSNQDDDVDRICSIHIRNGDFLNLDLYNFFDREQYINDAIQQIPSTINTIRVFSDDITTCKQYEEILKTRFKNIKYEMGNDQLDDLFKLSLYKYKILWNSTFSYWSGFISDNLFNSENLICCPKMTLKNEPASLRIKKHWKTF